MENAPIPFLPVPLPSSEVVFFDTATKKWLRKRYGKAYFARFEKYINRWQLIRRKHLGKPNPKTSKYSLILEYSFYFDLMGQYWPINSGKIGFSFIWYEPLTNKKIKGTTTTFDVAYSLYTAGALLSHAACAETRESTDSVMAAAKLFKEAATVFTYLKDVHMKKFRKSESFGPSLSNKNLTALRGIMLANAQQCVLEKALMVKMKPAVLSALASELSEMWMKIVKIQIEVKECFPSPWIPVGKFKEKFYDTIANFLISLGFHEDQEYGKAFSRCDHANDCMQICTKTRLPDDFKGPFAEFKERFDKKYAEVKNDKEKIFFGEVPEYSKMPELKKKRIAKCNDLDFEKISGKSNIFSDLQKL